ncbi:MAG TPA: 50S ribosomal protein L25, partial [Salinimicrobium sp.]|nr:50S ribosomal protein L25 [Salinimicrobium sp.]
LRYNLRRMRLKGLPGNLPDYIEADVSHLKIGDKLYVTSAASGDYKIMHPDNTVICQVRTSRNIVEDTEEELEEGAEEVAAGDVPASEEKPEEKSGDKGEDKTEK